ncbi:MAG: FAD-dependent oxidoreductase [Cellvibrio sp.]|nr:FAD-dependent oxidoreductase [Cellvibrio sp.]
MTSNLHQLPETVGIAGAGLLGRLFAWKLLQSGCKVTLFEAGQFAPKPGDTFFPAAFTAAGMIAPLSEAVVSDQNIYRMGQFALQQWPEWLKTLPSVEPFFYQRGSLVVAHPQDVSELTQFEQELQFVLPECNTYARINQQQIHELEPDLNPVFSEGLLLSEEGHINNRQLLTALGKEIIRLGVTLRDQTSVNVQPNKIVTNTNEETFDWVIDCRGYGAKVQDKKLRGVRGETLAVQTKEFSLQRPVRLMHPRYQLYIVPKPHNIFLIGATQIESEDKSAVSLQSSLELSSALYTLSSAFAEARIIELGVNLRPAYQDNLPRIQIQHGLITANGLFRHGYLLAPAIIESVLAYLGNKEQTVFCNLLQDHR